MNKFFAGHKALIIFGFLGLQAGFLVGCSTPPEPQVVPVVVDSAARLKSLVAQDLRFAEAVQSDGIAEAYRHFLAVDAVQLPDGGLPIGGREAIYAELLEVTSDADFSLTWEPVDASVAASGELGYTWGFYYYEALDELGAPYLAEGKYLYLWRHNNGRWELILDITNQTEPLYEDYESSLEDDQGEDGADAGGNSVPTRTQFE
jgi:ketosteroid isomerase-like protein